MVDVAFPGGSIHLSENRLHYNSFSEAASGLETLLTRILVRQSDVGYSDKFPRSPSRHGQKNTLFSKISFCERVLSDAPEPLFDPRTSEEA